MKETTEQAKEKMDKCISALEHEFSTIRAGRANPGVLDKIQVDYYGTMTPINAMAAISVSEARILVVQPWDASALKAVEKAIMASDIGINPTNDLPRSAGKTLSSKSTSTARRRKSRSETRGAILSKS